LYPTPSTYPPSVNIYVLLLLADISLMYVIGRNDYGQLFTGNTTRAYYATEVEKEKDILV